MSVAASLTIRNSLTTAAGLALWEGYMARAARAATGATAIVCSYERVLRDPLRWADALRDFLLARGVELTNGSPALAARSVDDALAHDHPTATASRLTAEQTALLETLTGLVGSHERFEPDLPPVTAATELMFAERRRLLLPPTQRAVSGAGPSSGIQFFSSRHGHADPTPSISVVIAPRHDGPGLESTIEAVLTVGTIGSPFCSAPPSVAGLRRSGSAWRMPRATSPSCSIAASHPTRAGRNSSSAPSNGPTLGSSARRCCTAIAMQSRD
jgi:hypothetical protein